MIEYARHEARLSTPAKDGSSHRSHLEHAAKRGVKSAIDALQGPEFPEELGHLWAWYLEMSMGADEGMNGLRLTWTALHAWATHMGISPEPRECVALFALDRAYHNPDPKKK